MNEPLIAFLHRLAIIWRGSFPQKCAGMALSAFLPSRGETSCLFFFHDNADQVIALLPPPLTACSLSLTCFAMHVFAGG